MEIVEVVRMLFWFFCVICVVIDCIIRYSKILIVFVFSKSIVIRCWCMEFLMLGFFIWILIYS